METALKTLNFGPEALWITLGTLVAMAALALLALQLVSHIRALRQPGLANDQHLQEQLRSDHDRLSALERATTRQEEELKLILRAQIVLIHHIVDGNGVENLKAMQRQIEEFLVYGNNFTFHRNQEGGKSK